VGNFKIILSIVVVAFLLGCSNKPEKPLFHLDENANDVLTDNTNCYEIFLKSYGIDLKKDPWFGPFQNYIKISNELFEKEGYSRFIYILLVQSGEVVTFNPIVLLYGTKGIRIINLKPKVPGVKEFNEKMLTRFNIDNMHKRLKAGVQSKLPTYDDKLLIVDFKEKDSCDCKFYRAFDSDISRQILSLEFFE